MLIIPVESLEVQRIVANAMSRHTFAIIQPSRHGLENQELATGVGVNWKGTYLIVTAAHVVAHCPESTLRFFLPSHEIQFVPNTPPNKPISAELRKLVELRDPMPPVFADEDDLAAIILPPQPGADECFFVLEDKPSTLQEPKEVGVFGYPTAVKVPCGKSYMASPEHFFGLLNPKGDDCNHEPIQNFTVPFPLPHRQKVIVAAGYGTGSRHRSGRRLLG